MTNHKTKIRLILGFFLFSMMSASPSFSEGSDLSVASMNHLAEHSIPRCSGLFASNPLKRPSGYECVSKSGVVWTKIKTGEDAKWQSEGRVYQVGLATREERLVGHWIDRRKLTYSVETDPSVGCNPGFRTANYSELRLASANEFFLLVPKVEHPITFADARLSTEFGMNTYSADVSQTPLPALIFSFPEVLAEGKKLTEIEGPKELWREKANLHLLESRLEWMRARSAQLCISVESSSEDQN